MFEHVRGAAGNAFRAWEQQLLDLAIQASLAEDVEARARVDASNARIDARLAAQGRAKCSAPQELLSLRV